MREILFRGKCTETGKWYTGYYINLHKTTYCFKEDYDRFKDNDIHQIVFEKMTDWGLPNQHLRVDVIPETIGQYTGLRDCKRTKEYPEGQMIFEGDIVKHHRTLWGADNSDVGTIQWCQKTCKFYRTSKFDTVHIVEIWEDTAEEYEVIGNIHDNPELLKGGEQE